MRRFLLKLRRRRNLERELEAELAFHDEMARAGGNSIPMGNALRIKEASGDLWRFTFLESLWRDIVYGTRGLYRNPTLTLIAVVSLTLGIGSTTAIFSVVDSVLLKPVPVPGADRFVMLFTTSFSPGGVSVLRPGSSAVFDYWRTQSLALEDVSGDRRSVMNYTGGDAVEQLPTMQMSADSFRSWGMPIRLGRGFTHEEDAPGGPRVTVISEDFWQRRFANTPQILSQEISLDGESYTVVGIVADSPFSVEQGPSADVYVPLQADSSATVQTQYFNVRARLRPGVSLEQANALLRVSAAEYQAAYPNVLGPKDGFRAIPYRDFVVGATRPMLLVLLGAVSLVLLIACANVANLLLARAATRSREISIRAAIGAGRRRVIRQLLTESLLLALAGGTLGLLLGFAGIRALLAVNTAGLNRVGANGTAVGMDWRVMGFALLVSVLTGILFGLVPAVQGSYADLNAVLKDSGGRSGTGRKQSKVRAALVVSEVGLAVILLVGSGLLIRTFVGLYSVNAGFETENVITLRTLLTGTRFREDQEVAIAIRDGVERIQALPGVVVASAADNLPLQGGYTLPFRIAGQAPAQGPYAGTAAWDPVAPGYFEVFRIRVKKGRTFEAHDDEASPAVVVINESMAKQFWKDRDPLGDRIVVAPGSKPGSKDVARQIVGIVGDVRNTGLDREPWPAVYVPEGQVPVGLDTGVSRLVWVAWVVRTQEEPRTLIPAIREQLRQATGLPVSDVRSMDEVVSSTTARQRFNMLLMTAFAFAALLLAAAGIYGLMAYSVEQRTQEIGIRLALGAEASQIKKTVVLEGMRLALAGVVMGIAAAWGLSRFLANFLYGVQSRDPLVFISVPIVLSAVALFAVWLPASRASRIDPLETIRYE